MKKNGRHVTRYPGIMRASRDLGVNRIHLYLVLTGKRVSHRLTDRYRMWQEMERREA